MSAENGRNFQRNIRFKNGSNEAPFYYGNNQPRATGKIELMSLPTAIKLDATMGTPEKSGALSQMLFEGTCAQALRTGRAIELNVEESIEADGTRVIQPHFTYMQDEQRKKELEQKAAETGGNLRSSLEDPAKKAAEIQKAAGIYRELLVAANLPLDQAETLVSNFIAMHDQSDPHVCEQTIKTLTDGVNGLKKSANGNKA